MLLIDSTLAFLPSPLLGPSVWGPVAEVLAAQGWNTVICSPPTNMRTGQNVLDAFAAALPIDRVLVLLPHSNAGAYVPALTTLHPVVGAVFVDAVLPPTRGWVPLAPLTFLDFLREKVGPDGLLRPWTDWWPAAETAQLFPDDDARSRIEQEQPRLPVSYFEGSVPVPQGWDDRPTAYLSFGDTYRDERDEAARRQWPLATTPGEHLHLLVDPVRVAAELVDLLGRLGLRLRA